MTYSVQLEADGIVQLPADLLASMKLEPGATIVLESAPYSDHVLVRQEREAEDRIYEDRGVLVYRALSGDPSYDFLNQVDEVRDDRMRQIMGWTTQEEHNVR